MSEKKSTTYKIYERFSPEVKWVVEDFNPDNGNTSEIDGKVVIGKVRGQFFSPGGTSRNGRYYPESLWEKVLKDTDVSSRMTERKMYGTIGHDEEPVSEHQLRNGEVSHIVTKLWIDVDEDSGKKRGMGEALILGTTAGQNLNIYLRAGSKLNTSSRASGKLLENKEEDGVPIVDEDSFLFETFDFVLDPGFLEANPSLVEKLAQVSEEEELDTMHDEKDNSVFNASLQTLIESRDSLKEQLNSVISEKNALEEELKRLKEKTGKLEKLETCAPIVESVSNPDSVKKVLPTVLENLGCKNIDELVSVLESVSKDDAEAIREGSIAEKMDELKRFKESVAPTPEKGVQIGERVSKELEKYRALGKPDQIQRVQEDHRKLRQSLRELGEIEEIKEALSKAKRELDRYESLGSRQEIEEALRSSLVLLKQYKRCGTPSKIMESIRKAEKLADFVVAAGGKSRILEVFEELKKTRKNRKEGAISRISETLSTKYRVPVTKVRDLVEKVGAKEAASLLAGLPKSDSLNEDFGDGKDNTVSLYSERSSLVESLYSQAGKGI